MRWTRNMTPLSHELRSWPEKSVRTEMLKCHENLSGAATQDVLVLENGAEICVSSVLHKQDNFRLNESSVVADECRVNHKLILGSNISLPITTNHSRRLDLTGTHPCPLRSPISRPHRDQISRFHRSPPSRQALCVSLPTFARTASDSPAPRPCLPPPTRCAR